MVPLIFKMFSVPLPAIARIPVPEAPAMFARLLITEIVGLPATPSAFETANPLPEIARLRLIKLLLVLTTMPLASPFKFATAPLKPIEYVLCAPPSVKLKPDPTAK